MEENETTTETIESTPALNEEKLGELIKKGFKESLDSYTQSTQQSTQQQSTEAKDPWDEVLEPRISKRTQQSNITAQSAEDKADFYTSDFWLTELEELLPGDTETDEGKLALSKAKKEVRENIETTFSNLVKQGRGIPRKDIADFAIGQYIKKNKASYMEGVSKKSSLRKEMEVKKAQRAVDMNTGNISNFSPEQIHKMEQSKIDEQFGSVLF